MELVLKTSGQQCLVGSNPTPSAESRCGSSAGPRGAPQASGGERQNESRYGVRDLGAGAAAGGLTPTRRLGGRSIARHGQLEVTTPARSVFKFFSMAFAVLATSSVVFGTIVWVNLFGGVSLVPSMPGESNVALPEIEGGINVLIIGSDDRTGQGAEFGEGEEEASGVLNDVNILIHIADDRSNATAVSIPRDTVVDTPACTNDRGEQVPEQEAVPFNSILHEGGVSCVVQAAEAMSGLDVQYAAMVQFRGVIEMSNAIGGVEVCVSSPIEDDYVGLYLSEGVHSLKGEDALKFLRTRHGVGDGSDLARISNQQVFLSALLRQIKSGDTLTNPIKLYGLARAATQNMTMTENLNNLETLAQLGNVVAKVPIEQIALVSLPVASSDWGGKVEPKQPDADRMWELLRNDASLTSSITSPGGSVDPSAVPPDGAEGSEGPSEPADPADPGQGGDGAVGTDGQPGPSPEPSLNLTGQGASNESCSPGGG